MTLFFFIRMIIVTHDNPSVSFVTRPVKLKKSEEDLAGNFYRHRLSYHSNGIYLDISDNGKGFPGEEGADFMDKRKGSGLINMKNRALMLGSTWNIETSANGTIIKLTVPY